MRHLLAAFDLTSREFIELAALEVLDPSPGVRGDVQFAQLCAVVANSRMAGKDAKTFQPADFLIRWGEKPKKASVDDVLDIFRSLGE